MPWQCTSTTQQLHGEFLQITPPPPPPPPSLPTCLPACLPATSLTHSTHQQIYPPPHPPPPPPPPPPAVAAAAAALPVCHIRLCLRQSFLHPVLQIFAQHIRRNVLRVFGKASNSIISRQLGEIWRSLPRPVKERYDAEAARLVKIHQIEFPDYKYQPKKKTAAAAAAAASASTNQLSEAHRKRAATMPSTNHITTPYLLTNSHPSRLFSLSTSHFAEDSSHCSGLVNTPSTSPTSTFSRFTSSPSSASSAAVSYSSTAYPTSPSPYSASTSSSSSCSCSASSSLSCSCGCCCCCCFYATPQEVCETNAQQGGSACICENPCQPQSRQRYFSSPNAPLLTQSAVFARTASCSLPAFHYQSAQTRGSAVLSTQNVHANHETTVRGNLEGSECSRWNYATSESDSGIFSPIESDAFAWPDSSVIDPVHNELHQHDRTTWKVGCEQDTRCALDETWGQIASNEVLDFRPLSTEAEMVLGPTLRQPPPSPVTPLRTPIRPTEVCQMSDRESCCPHLSNLLSADMEPIVRTDSSLLQSDWSVYA
ncbi:hypothetical protein SprV_0501904300 [Sparganum proliferum]